MITLFDCWLTKMIGQTYGIQTDNEDRFTFLKNFSAAKMCFAILDDKLDM